MLLSLYQNFLMRKKIICKIKNYPIAEVILTKKDRTGRDYCYKLNTSKAKKLLGWKNKYSLKNGLVETMNFFQKKY